MSKILVALAICILNGEYVMGHCTYCLSHRMMLIFFSIYPQSSTLSSVTNGEWNLRMENLISRFPQRIKRTPIIENNVCHARRCIGRKWPMDQMCSKCEIHCFSHELWKISKLWNFRKFLNCRKFPKSFFVRICFFFKEFF